jgi:hypothetical protein
VAKELIGGFEAIELGRTYAAILGGTPEIDVRLVEQEEGSP